MPNLNMLDSSAMEDLEELLQEVQIYRDRYRGFFVSDSSNVKNSLFLLLPKIVLVYFSCMCGIRNVSLGVIFGNFTM